VGLHRVAVGLCCLRLLVGAVLRIDVGYLFSLKWASFVHSLFVCSELDGCLVGLNETVLHVGMFPICSACLAAYA